MATSMKRLGAAALAGAAVCLLAAPPALAQFTVTPAYSFRAGAPLNQNYYNLAAYGRALQAFPPYAFPFNRGGLTAYTSPGMGYASTPYTAGYGWEYGWPYASSPGLSGYETGYNPYYPYADPYGGGLRGAADIIRSCSAELVSPPPPTTSPPP
jgi:hypothetical protein